MNTRVRLQPVEGRLVRIPGNYEALPADGKEVELNSYWHRKVQAGDVVVVEPAEQAKKPAGDK